MGCKARKLRNSTPHQSIALELFNTTRCFLPAKLSTTAALFSSISRTNSTRTSLGIAVSELSSSFSKMLLNAETLGSFASDLSYAPSRNSIVPLSTGPTLSGEILSSALIFSALSELSSASVASERSARATSS